MITFIILTGNVPWKLTSRDVGMEFALRVKEQSLTGIQFPSDIPIS
jgi:hypothetical protein